MAITLKEQTILNEWNMILDQAAGNANLVLEDIVRRLDESKIPGNCNWEIVKIKTEEFFGRAKREFLYVTLEQFSDYHIYISIRDFGAHLDCCRFLTVEPGLIRKWASEKLTGYEDALSVPKNILDHQDLRAWVTVVHYAVLDSVEALMTKLEQDPNLLNRDTRGILEIW